MKTCKICNKTKPKTEFHKHSKYKDKLWKVCKECRKKQGVIYREKNKERLRQYDRQTRLTSNKERYSGLKKRAYTNYCEMCGRKQQKKLNYHHWDDSNLNLGIWICFNCHRLAHAIEDGVDIDRYKVAKIIATIETEKFSELFV